MKTTIDEIHIYNDGRKLRAFAWNRRGLVRTTYRAMVVIAFFPVAMMIASYVAVAFQAPSKEVFFIIDGLSVLIIECIVWWATGKINKK